MLPLPNRARRFLLALLLAPLAACQAPHPPHPTVSACHPACPGARAARVVVPGEGLRSSADRSSLPAEPAQHPPSTAAYLCPMHVTLGSSEPGRCPECGMKLVPRAQALGHDHGN